MSIVIALIIVAWPTIFGLTLFALKIVFRPGKLRNLRDEAFRDAGTTAEDAKDAMKASSNVYSETFIYAIFAIAANYAFVLAGASSVEPIVEVCFYLCKSI